MSQERYPAYWIELAKRAYADGHDNALDVIDAALRRDPDRPADDGMFYYSYRWFWEYWLRHRFDEDGVPADLR